MFDQIVQINAEVLFSIANTMAAVALFSIIFRAFYPMTVNDMKLDETLINTIKLIGYGFLAVYIYMVVDSKGITEIDVLTFFTFLLAVFEATHYFMLTISVFIGTGIRLVFDRFFGWK